MDAAEPGDALDIDPAPLLDELHAGHGPVKAGEDDDGQDHLQHGDAKGCPADGIVAPLGKQKHGHHAQNGQEGDPGQDSDTENCEFHERCILQELRLHVGVRRHGTQNRDQYAEHGKQHIGLHLAGLHLAEHKADKPGQVRDQIDKAVDHDRIELAADEGRERWPTSPRRSRLPSMMVSSTHRSPRVNASAPPTTTLL